MILKKFM